MSPTERARSAPAKATWLTAPEQDAWRAFITALPDLMAAFEAEESALRGSFALLRRLRDEAEGRGHRLPELSMGMSGDFAIAVEEGATMVRLGTVLFGERQ